MLTSKVSAFALTAALGAVTIAIAASSTARADDTDAIRAKLKAASDNIAGAASITYTATYKVPGLDSAGKVTYATYTADVTEAAPASAALKISKDGAEVAQFYADGKTAVVYVDATKTYTKIPIPDGKPLKSVQDAIAKASNDTIAEVSTDLLINNPPVDLASITGVDPGIKYSQDGDKIVEVGSGGGMPLEDDVVLDSDGNVKSFNMSSTKDGVTTVLGDVAYSDLKLSKDAAAASTFTFTAPDGSKEAGL